MEANNTNRTANRGNNTLVNNTVVRGFIATDPVVRNFAETSVIRFALAVRTKSTSKKSGETTSQSSLITVEKWAKNTNLASFEAIKKGRLVEVKGTLKPNEWTAADGSHRSRIILGARSVKEVARPASQMEPKAEAQPEAVAS